MALSLFDSGRRSNVFDPFSLDIWDPFEGFSSSVANIPSSARETSAFANTRIDWKETPEAHVFKADLPGLKKEEVKVEVEDGRVLQISGERSREQEEKNDKWHRVERSSGKFMRRFRLPENAKMDQIRASMENGVLTVTVPKEDVKKPEVYIVLLDPSLESTKDVALEFLAKVVEGRTPAESLVYVYENVVTGFAARLTVKEAEKLARLQGVLSVNPGQNYQIGNPTAYGLELSEKSAGEISPISS
ncbi:18.1 kDa class I heat shock protein [Citrus sinensis]|uniref:18.1 kDa class I heat shock protein n=1 Tax=Citrus sinensis TaxID=2711 RepID=A0ACB8L0G4_CITSI|nr:18.1 kDa class I heat shock protein [Citrus sinensis]